jgi:hypothetical protein
MRVSIIITSYNYGRFLGYAVESALRQTHRDVEVVVVDDGSADESPQIIRSFGKRIRAVFKENGGQASAWNAGLPATTGDAVIFLDSDDVLLSSAAEQAAACLENPAVAKVHWPMQVIDRDGSTTGRVVPCGTLSSGDLREQVLREGPEAYAWSPTSGNAWHRAFLERVFPIPAETYRICPDLYLAALVPMFGSVHCIDSPHSLWRVHGRNNTWAEPFQRRLPQLTERWDLACSTLAEHCRARGLDVDVDAWKKNAWCHRVERAARAICSHVPRSTTFTLADGNDWGTDQDFFGRTCRPFVERAGQYWGPPADDEDAIRECRRQCDTGSAFLVIAWPCFWWEQHYPGFVTRLERCGKPLHRDTDLVIFGLNMCL